MKHYLTKTGHTYLPPQKYVYWATEQKIPIDNMIVPKKKYKITDVDKTMVTADFMPKLLSMGQKTKIGKALYKIMLRYDNPETRATMAGKYITIINNRLGLEDEDKIHI